MPATFARSSASRMCSEPGPWHRWQPAGYGVAFEGGSRFGLMALDRYLKALAPAEAPRTAQTPSPAPADANAPTPGA